MYHPYWSVFDPSTPDIAGSVPEKTDSRQLVTPGGDHPVLLAA
jgi:hypothetical protein